MDTPDWLKSNKSVITYATAVRRLRNLEHGNMFDGLLDKISVGIPLKTILMGDLRAIDSGGLLQWIHKDPEREQRYHEAQRIGAEILSAEIIEIADAEDSLEDVQRSRLKVDTRKFLLGVWNRKRFGDVKQIELGVTISITQALKDANTRVIDGIAEEVLDVEHS